MADVLTGIRAEGQPDGTVVIVSASEGRKVTLRVTANYARQLAAELLVASAPWVADNPAQADGIVSSYLRAVKRATDA